MALAGTPNNLVLVQGDVQVYLSWDLAVGATTYDVQRSSDNITFASVGTPAVPNYLDTSVTAGVQYYYKVASVNGSGTSLYTNAQTIVPTKAGEMSLLQVKTLALQEADRLNTNFISPQELNNYVNQSYFELYDLLVTVYEDYYLEQPVLFQTTGNNQMYDLPNGTNAFMDQDGNALTPRALYKLSGVDCGLALSSNAWVNLTKFDFVQRNQYVYPNITSTFLGVFNMRYRMLGSKLMLIPNPGAGQYIRLWYVPRLQWLLKDSDVLDGISGWTEYVIVDTAIKILEKEESDTTSLMQRKLMLRQRIEETAMNRDQGAPDTISPTRTQGTDGNGGGGWGSFGGY